jgi:hypothetical protein
MRVSFSIGTLLSKLDTALLKAAQVTNVPPSLLRTLLWVRGFARFIGNQRNRLLMYLPVSNHADSKHSNFSSTSL